MVRGAQNQLHCLITPCCLVLWNFAMNIINTSDALIRRKFRFQAVQNYASNEHSHEVKILNLTEIFTWRCVAKGCLRWRSRWRHDVHVTDVQTFMNNNKGRTIIHNRDWDRLPGRFWKSQHSIALIDLNSIQGTSILKVAFLSSGETWIQAFYKDDAVILASFWSTYCSQVIEFILMLFVAR